MLMEEPAFIVTFCPAELNRTFMYWPAFRFVYSIIGTGAGATVFEPYILRLYDQMLPPSFCTENVMMSAVVAGSTISIASIA
jgi:hypothetical protein